MSSRKTAFTLIELLVVIAIIAILAAILFPVFAQAREKARAVTCLSNQKNIGTGIQMYAQDYDEMILPWLSNAERTHVPAVPARDRSWVMKVQPYIKNGTINPNQQVPNGIFQCPSFNVANYLKGADAAGCDGDGTPNSSGLAGLFPPVEFFSNFGVAFYFATLAGTGTEPDPYFQFPGADNNTVGAAHTRGLAEIVRPAETALISDGISLISGGSIWTSEGCEAAYIHQEGGNLIFLDGHAKRIPRNNERYLDRDQAGFYFKRYHTFSK